MDSPFAAQAELALLGGRIGEALRFARMGLSLTPDDPGLLELAADSATQLGEDAYAARCWQRLIDQAPENAQAWNGLAIARQRSGALDAAETAWRQALLQLPDDANLHTNLGLLLVERGMLAEAESHQRHAAAQAPDSAPILTNLADLLARCDRPAEAEALYRAALQRQPDFATAHCNLGVLLTDLARPGEAEAAFRQALALQPDFHRCQTNLGQLLLAQGRFTEGWQLHEGRLRTQRSTADDPLRAAGIPQWQGEPLDGRSIIVLPEQGFGDEIQFCRYLPELKARGAARVTLLCRPALTALLQGVPGADAVVDQREASTLLSQHDYWSVLLSLPLRAGTTLDTIPAAIPYLRADPQRTHRLAPRLTEVDLSDELRIGLVWRGNPRHTNDTERSLPGLEVLAPLWAIKGTRFFSLQKCADVQPPVPAAQPLTDLAPFIEDFADTAAFLAGLDLLITVDTAVAHLAGALGLPCWVLLPYFKTDWRWLQLRGDSPWYPTLRLFRQPRRGDWHTPVAMMAAALEQLRGECDT